MSKRSGIIITIIIVAAIAIGIVIGLLVGGRAGAPDQRVTDFESCAEATGVVMESYPRQCRDEATGITYVEEVDNPVPATREFMSENGVTLRLKDWTDGAELKSPLTITGEVPGNWSFEASFPVILTDWDGRIIAQAPATLQGDWMTEDYVPFTATLTFDSPTVYKTGALILQKDNPSGLPENDDAVEIGIRYQ